jgi:hypothetical protein
MTRTRFLQYLVNILTFVLGEHFDFLHSLKAFRNDTLQQACLGKKYIPAFVPHK